MVVPAVQAQSEPAAHPGWHPVGRSSTSLSSRGVWGSCPGKSNDVSDERVNDRSEPGPTSTRGTDSVSPDAGRSPVDRPVERPAGPGRSRVGGLWAVLVLAAIVLVLLLIFVLQNGQRVQISFLGALGHIPLGVALLLAAVGGALIVAIPGTGRILQLRRTTRRQRQ